jgi:tRNA-2-methylthio-N6-dimethylallyladenosine synthase
VAQARLEALQNLLRELTLAAQRARVGARTEILVEGESRRGGQVQGRDPWHRVVNTLGAGHARPGELLAVEIVEATPHSLIAEPLPPAAGPEALKVRSRPADEPERAGIQSRWV